MTNEQKTAESRGAGAEEKRLGDTTEEVQSGTAGAEAQVTSDAPATPKGMLTKDSTTGGQQSANDAADTLQPAKD